MVNNKASSSIKLKTVPRDAIQTALYKSLDTQKSFSKKRHKAGQHLPDSAGR
jgi:hypothetical protein